jgi:tetratricopeptide (TPR) repeat protein
MSWRRISIVFGIVFFLSAISASAQTWAGNGRISGKVVDEQGNGVQGALIKAVLEEAGDGPEAVSNAKGDWEIRGLAAGEWLLTVGKEGLETRQVSVSLTEKARPRVQVRLGPDPFEALTARMSEGAVLLQQRKFAEARAIYEPLAAEFPDVYQVHLMIARSYHLEGQRDKAIEAMRQAENADPENVEVKLLLANLLVEFGRLDEAQEIVARMDESKLTASANLVNLGLALLKHEKTEPALSCFDKSISRFPADADAYYLRGVTRLRLDRVDEAQGDLEKYLELAPQGPSAANARKLLEQIKGF